MSEYCLGEYDVVVIGAGHAGCEAALASARMGKKTAAFVINLDTLANMRNRRSRWRDGKKCRQNFFAI